MIKYKNQEQIKTIAEGGKILSKIMGLTEKKIKPGLTGAELNDYTEKLIEASGGEASFKNYKAAWTERVYPSALCISINNQVVHGIPDNYKFKEGDIVGSGLRIEIQRTLHRHGTHCCDWKNLSGGKKINECYERVSNGWN
jgi:methionine aminopeptidase